MNPTFYLSLSPLNVRLGMPVSINCIVSDQDGDLNSFGVRWQGYGLISGSVKASGSSAQWIGNATPDKVGPNYFRCEVWDDAGNGVTGDWQEVNVMPAASSTPATAASPQPAIDINNLDPTKAGQTEPAGPWAGNSTLPATTIGGNSLQTIYGQNDPAAVVPPSPGNVAITPSTALSTLTVSQWLAQRPDLVNNWNNANDPRFANDPLSVEIKRFGSLDNYARWTALMDGAGQAGNAPSTAALELYLEARPDLRNNWQNAQAAQGSNDPLVASILSYGSLGSYARAAAQANPGAPAAGNQVATSPTSGGSSTSNATPPAGTTPAASSDLLKLAIPAATIFAAFFR